MTPLSPLGIPLDFFQEFLVVAGDLVAESFHFGPSGLGGEAGNFLPPFLRQIFRPRFSSPTTKRNRCGVFRHTWLFIMV